MKTNRLKLGIQPPYQSAPLLLLAARPSLVYYLYMPECLLPWFQEAVERDLLPLFPRAKLTVQRGRRRAQALVAFEGRVTSVKFGVPQHEQYLLRLSRSTKFTTASRHLIRTYCELIGQAQKTWKGPLTEVSGVTMRRLVAQTVLPEVADTAVLLLDYLANWAEETYEGRKVAAAVLIDGSRSGIGPDLKEIFSLPCSHIISDGVDSWIEVDGSGKLLERAKDNSTRLYRATFFPYRYSKIVAATAQKGAMAAVLNRNGEILVFSKGRLIFAKRRGSWRYFDHSEVISALSTGGNNSLRNRRAIYLSCLDASFARCGAGCAIIPNNKVHSPLLLKLVSAKDRVDNPLNAKSRLMKNIIGGLKFDQISRHTRRELLGIDGSTIVSSSGAVLAVGAIVKVGSGSSGGGRRAAAKSLSRLGVALKVSADGKISVFRDGKEEPVFEIG